MSCRFLLLPCFLLLALPSWNEGRAKQAILQFVQDTTTPSHRDYIAPDDRVAVFDQDGTLWVEQPVYTQLAFAREAAKTLPPNESVQSTEEIVAKTHSGMTVDVFNAKVAQWLQTAKHPRFDKPYTALIYQPMLEVLKLFEAHGYRVYIVSGGGQQFIRVYAQAVYGLGPDRIIGSAGKVKYGYQNGHPELVKMAEVLFVDDKAGKPEAIQLFIGKRPVAAFGNSDGDQQMLEWSQSHAGRSLQVLIHHDDAEREYAYDVASPIGQFSQALMDEAIKKGWIVVNMKNDWKVVFPP